MNAKTVGVLSLLLVAGTGTSWGQSCAVLYGTTVLTDSCGGGDPLPDGTLGCIYWDRDNDGPDETDSLLEVGNCQTCVNFNCFGMNGLEFLGEEGVFFISDPIFCFGGVVPQPNAFYIRVIACHNDIRWTSETFLIPQGFGEILLDEWTCGPCPLSQINSCSASTIYDDRIALSWMEVSGEDGYEILRKEADEIAHFEIIAQTAVNVHTFDDFTAAPGQEYLYKVRSFSSIYGQGSESPVARGRRVLVEPIVFGEVIVTTNISGVMSAEAADLDADGDMDVVAAGMFANKVAWYENNGSWGFTEHELITGWRGARAVDVGDIDGDGDLDIVAVAKFENSLVWWENLPDGYWMQPISSSVMGATDVVIGNPFGNVKFLTAAAETGEISAWTYLGDQGFQREAFATNLPGVRSLTVGAFLPPFHGYFVTAAAAESGSLMQWRSLDGYLPVEIGVVPGLVACSATLLNVEADSVNDIYFCSSGGSFGWWERRHDEPNIISNLLDAPRHVAEARIDDDNRNDLLLASGHDISWWRNTPNRFYRNVICDNLPQASFVKGLDADADGDMDVLCAGDNEIRFYLSALSDTLDNAALVKQPEPSDNRISSLPREFELLANYPNPFNALTNIQFALPEASDVKLAVFDITGRLITTLANGSYAAGYHTLTFDANALSSGVYFYRLEAGEFGETKKMVLLK